MNITISGKFNVNYDYSYPAFPYESNLFITNQIVLSDNCKKLFGEKRVHVRFDNTTTLSDRTTFAVLQYISIENISIPLLIYKTIHINKCYEYEIALLTNFIISLNKRTVS